MLPRHPSLRRASAQGGIALIVVLWLLALLTLLATTVLTMSVAHRRAAASLGESIRARAIIDGGIRLELLHLIAPPAAELGAAILNRQLQVLGTAVDLRIERESGRLDLNTANEGLLFAFFAANGWSEDNAHSMAARIADWKDPDDTPREGGAELQEYLAAGRRPGPRNGPFESVDELYQVLGSEAVSAELMDSLTVYSHLPAPSPIAATPAVLRALTWADQHQLEGKSWLAGAAGPLDAASQPPSLIGQVIRVHACMSLRHQRFCRVVVMRLTGNPQTPFQVYLWSDSSSGGH